MQSLAISLLLCLVGTSQSDTLPERRGLERGNFKERAPEVQDRLLGPEPAHQDTTGSCDQVLLALDAAPDGTYGAIWMDTRQGNLGLYLGIVDARGAVRGEELPVYPSIGTARQLQPDLAFTGDRGGMLAWRSGVAPQKPIQIRRFRDTPGFPMAPQGYGAPPAEGDLDPNAPVGRGDAGGRSSRGSEPRVAALADGHSLVVWTQDSRAHAQRFDGEGEPVGDVQLLDPQGDPATSNVTVASDAGGTALVAWPTRGGLRVWVGSGERAVRTDAGQGRLLDVAHDPRGGWWLLVQPAEGEAQLRHLDARGAVDRPDARLPGSLFDRKSGEGRWSDLDLDVWKHGLAVAATGTRDQHAVRVILLDADAQLLPREWHPQARTGALNARIASSGPDSLTMLVAWTDDRHGDRDIFYSVLQSGPKGAIVEPGEALRWNTDVGSSSQGQAAVASNGRRARVAWRDSRNGATRLWMRDLEATRTDCKWAGDERLIPVGDGDVGGEESPELALADDGSGIVAWKRSRGRQWFVRALDPAGDAAGDVHALGKLTGELILAVHDDGYLLSALDEHGALFVQALAQDAEPVGERIVVAEQLRAPIETTALTQLARKRWVVVYTRHAGERRGLEARFFDDDLDLEDDLVRLPYSGLGGDLQPAVAPAKKGGFLLSWTAFDSRGRDVAAMLIDRKGEAADRPLAISPSYNEQDNSLAAVLAKGDFVVVWEDDISRWDQIYARRVDAKGREMGPAVTLNGMDMAFTMGRTGPALAPLGKGFVCAWVDRSRGLGPDVFVTVVGDDFDEL